MGNTWYSLARGIWQAARWIWTAIIIAIIVGVTTTLFAGTKAAVASSFVGSIFDWFNSRGFYVYLTFSLIGLFILVTLASGIITFAFRKKYEPTYTPPPEIQAILDYIEQDVEATKKKDEVQQARDREAFTQYLRSIEEQCATIRLGGFAHLSRALIFAEVPLNETFVPLPVVSDEPLYDAPGEQQRQFEAMRQRADLSTKERDAFLQGLHIIWQSQLRWSADGEQTQQPLLIDELLSRLSSNNPVAVLLGTPGSGKSTFLHWLALTMTRTTLTPGAYPIPNGFGREQVPILIQTREYAERLEKEDLSLKQFLILHWNKIHPNLASKLLDELSQGRCLVLLDGLDQGASVHVRRHLIEAIREFIADYSSGDPHTYNRFIITTRIADSEPGAFARNTHFTMLDLDQQRIEHMLATWCLAIAHFQTRTIKGMGPLTDQEETEARTTGAKLQAQLSQMLQHNPDLMRLAVNPLALTIMVLLQASGRNLLQSHIELCQTITRTLLDYWNRESGRKMFSSDEVSLAEQLLSNLAYSLHESGTLLTAYDVQTTTRQTLATYSQRQPDEIKLGEIAQFIETLRRSSGLFVEGGEELFYFANRTIQDYYVVQRLLHLPQEELKQFALQHYHLPLWREPLLLALIEKRRQAALTERLNHHAERAPHEESPTQSVIFSKPEERANEIQTLRQERQLTRQQAEELLAACIDARPLPEAMQQQLGVKTVQAVAWLVLRQPFVLEPDAMEAAITALDSSKAPICEGAATLLQHTQALPQEVQQKAAQKLWQLLIDDTQHRYATLGYFELLRLYDRLFQTLEAVTYHPQSVP